jgi:hypothetical protein
MNKMAALDRYLERAKGIVDYYERLTQDPNKSDCWQLGLLTARQWLQILQNSPDDLEQLGHLYQKLESERMNQGSGWLDMLLQVRNWIAVVEQQKRR